MITEKVRMKLKQAEMKRKKEIETKEKIELELDEYFKCFEFNICPICGEDLLITIIPPKTSWLGKSKRTRKKIECPNNCTYNPPHFGREFKLEELLNDYYRT